MTVIAIGDIANKFLMDYLPERGIVIEATRDELMNLPPVLYREVDVKAKEGGANDRMNRVVEGLDTVKLRQALGACIIQMCDRCRAAAELDGLNVPCVVGCETLRMAKEALEVIQ